MKNKINKDNIKIELTGVRATGKSFLTSNFCKTESQFIDAMSFYNSKTHLRKLMFLFVGFFKMVLSGMYCSYLASALLFNKDKNIHSKESFRYYKRTLYVFYTLGMHFSKKNAFFSEYFINLAAFFYQFHGNRDECISCFLNSIPPSLRSDICFNIDADELKIADVLTKRYKKVIKRDDCFDSYISNMRHSMLRSIKIAISSWHLVYGGGI